MKKNTLFFKLFLIAILIGLPLLRSKTLFAEESSQVLPKDNTRSLELSATVSSIKASYYIEIPAEISFGAIRTDKDSSYNYEIKLTTDHLEENASILIASPEKFPMVSSNNEYSFPCYNNIIQKTFTGNDTCVGTLTILKEDSFIAPKDSYSGTLQFQITYTKKNDDLSNDNSLSTPYKVNSKITGAKVSGLDTYTASAPSGNYVFSIQPALAKDHAAEIAKIASLISAGSQSGRTTYYDFSLTYDNKNEISDTKDCVIEIYLPIDNTDKNKTITAYRYHGTTVSLMQCLAKRPTSDFMDNTYYYDLEKGFICFYSSKFSVFATHTMPVAAITSTASSSVSKNTLASNKETNYTAMVSLRKNTDFNAISMCNPLFYKQADLVVNGDNTELTLYVIDPIPNYSSEGTPLSNIVFSYNNASYPASIDSSNKVMKSYYASSGFISEAGNYSSSKITVTLPTDSVNSSVNKGLTCSAYINAVMKCTQQFFVVLTDFQEGSSEVSASEETSSKIKTVSKEKNDVKKDTLTDSQSEKAAIISSTQNKPRNNKGKTVELSSSEEEIADDETALAPSISQKKTLDYQKSDVVSLQTYGYQLVTDAMLQLLFYISGTILVCVSIFLIRKVKISKRIEDKNENNEI